MTPAWHTAGDSTRTTPIQWDSSWPAFVPEPQRSDILRYFDTRFGIPLPTFHGFHLVERQKLFVLVRHSSHLEAIASLKVKSVGLPVLRKMPRHIKPTTAALQRFGHHATRHTLTLSTLQLRTLFQDGVLPLQVDIQPGYVVLLHAGHVLGCGLYTPDRLRSQIPRRLSAHQHFEAS